MDKHTAVKDLRNALTESDKLVKSLNTALKKIEELKQFVESCDKKELKEGDYVRVINSDSGGHERGVVGKVIYYDTFDNDFHIEANDTAFWHEARELQKITKEEYEEEKKLLAEGWIPHVGNKSPVDDDVMVKQRYSLDEGKTYIIHSEPVISHKVYWYNVTHYRIVKQNPYGLTGCNAVCIVTDSEGERKRVGILAYALNTWLELLSCDGVEEKVDKLQYIFHIGDELFIGSYLWEGDKLTEISPAFDTKENAQKAIDKIGKDRLMSMFKVMGGKFDG